jgi:hypothetical protein
MPRLPARNVFPPSTDRASDTPPTYWYFSSDGSTRNRLKYIGRGLMLLTRFHVSPPSADR